MGFWLTFAKKVIDKAVADALGSGSKPETKKLRCVSCGMSYSPEALVKGECLVCRVSQQQKQRERSRGAEADRPRSDNDLPNAYKILGCSETDSDEHIKRQYRKLVKECHVDSLPKDLPDYLVQTVNARFREVREAYDKVMKSRNNRNSSGTL